MFKTAAVFVFFTLCAVAAKAQDTFWVQTAARPTLTAAQDLVRDFDRRLDGVHGFYIGSGFYGIAVGPYDSRPSAEGALQQFLARGQVPGDSFITDGRRFEQQFWPIGGGITPPRETATTEVPRDVVAVVSPTELPDETVREARASEGRLTRAEREELQIAMRWAGFYNAAIDGSFGRGTRGAMESWQIANNQEPTGVLTTRQRATLLAAYNAVLTEASMRVAEDASSGIAMEIPTSMVSFSQYQPPFVMFNASADVPQAKVLFISQAGDADRLRGLYEVMQSLAIIPTEGPRRLRRDRFEIEGVDDTIHSYTSVTLQDGEIKGFTFVWPAGDDQRRTRILVEMQDSFTRLSGTLDPNIVPVSEDQSVDLVAGLAVRQPQMTRSGFYVSTDGLAVTTADAVADCTRVTVDGDIDMTVSASNPDLGIALLAPVAAQTPIGTAAFNTSVPRLNTRIAVAGFPYNGALAAPTLTFGSIADLRSLTGDARMLRLSATAQSGDAGGPVLDESGAVLGVLLPKPSTGGQVLPADVSFALKASDLTAFLEAQQVIAAAATDSAPLDGVALAARAADLTVLVSCW